jgi:hypothetical protein
MGDHRGRAVKILWAAVAGFLESLLLAGDHRWHDEEVTLRFDRCDDEPTIEVIDPLRTWFRCRSCGRAWSPRSILGMPKDWWQCPAGCNTPTPTLSVVNPAPL